MPISPDTRRARSIAATRRAIAELLVEDQFASNRSIAGAVGSGHELVARVRAELTGVDGLIASSSTIEPRAGTDTAGRAPSSEPPTSVPASVEARVTELELDLEMLREDLACQAGATAQMIGRLRDLACTVHARASIESFERFKVENP